MKSAKEWAAEVVTEAEQRRPGAYSGWILDGKECVALQGQTFEQEADTAVAEARGIIERLVERVQADVCAPLEETVAQRDAYIHGLQREVNEWRKVACDRGRALGDVADALEELRGVAVPGSTAEDICERLLPKIEEALR